ncbi:hypothetical protein pEaSNUABM50_00433 [Erwinia phage pEa_SNUABM_50]|uniref:Uncharacterized protein n=4 Tax=Eneladusvirus BF TaxID=2560751 RepID=A0A7L8ZP29_9CAUD|nr:hypothetical protein FDH34_gp491 [Serratia phage BF]QOI71368.1 hypothetical protein pEaSNUABM12_00439 [Erwinia phage pEa_SNUABM_12]QOI71910.1 hypothetical protein pEaSNUABM47_00435 [Erwinia phage pEa_SNUABM_47]QOI72449.1 hypothetical protein pEaSNUABM50_00433 [Erwinia phage pEa_SNUABM_50]QXO11576.1 hypothetical protein pEaSNUABM19_00439 [Erwinia phage pEa_SNUABM_19]QXO12124.1 hypothetical protein pEaSNUABM44_00437 [Erwinia phage pEa_SNUABM_44]QXO12677.1 hypothetical protein pEaSNUABM49_004
MKTLYCWVAGLISVMVGIMITSIRMATWPQGNMYYLSYDERLFVGLWGGGLFCMWVLIIALIVWLVVKGTD